jgi:16S rRNA (uracil1498-N3)-methyltransferase
MADRFFVTRPPPPGETVLTGPEAHHLAAVRRFAAGDRVVLFCGDGNEYPAEILAVGKKQVTLTVSVAVPVSREVGFRLEIAAALPKGDRGDFLVEKLTELGATRLVPLVTARAVVRPGESRVENLRRAVIEASKQCGRNVLMRVDPPAAWEAFLRAADLPATRYLLHPAISAGVNPAARSNPPADVVVAVGPEGGFTDDEVAAAVAAGWRPVSLGPRVLRVETAAVAAAVLLGGNPM